MDWKEQTAARRALSEENHRIPAKFQTKGNIINYALHMKKNGRAEATIKRSIEVLTALAKLCDLNNPEETKLALANLKWKNNTKNTTAGILKMYYKFLNIPFEKPKYAKENELPFIPTEQEIDNLIVAGCHRTATRLQIFKETGARNGEIEKLKWLDIDTQRKTIYITAEKGSNSRILPISEKLVAMLNRIPKVNDKVFQVNKENFRKTFESLRKRTAIKLNNPRFYAIHLHTFRHWKGTMEYHKTKDIIHVKTVLGHKDIKSTMVYINLESAIFLATSDEWTHIVAKTLDEACKAIDAGFEYVTDIDGNKLFRKRK
jgi:integrase